MNANTLLALPLLLSALLLFGCAQKQAIQLDGVEVRNYEGKDLSSVNDFRENSIAGPQYVDEETYSLNVHGLVESPRNYTYGEVLSHQAYTKVVRLYCVEGWNVNILWEGVLLSDLIGNTKPGATTVIFRSYDGYSSTLPFDYVKDNSILLAYKLNNVTLPPAQGFPFQVVAEDKYGYKWAKWITEIEIGNDPAFLGYWESRGYSQNGSLNGPIRE